MITDTEFVSVLSGSSKTASEIADGLSVSKPTIGRWLAGVNLPMQGLRAAMVKYLMGVSKETTSEA